MRMENATTRHKRILARFGRDGWDDYKTREEDLKADGKRWTEIISALAEKYAPYPEDSEEFPSLKVAERKFIEKEREEKAVPIEDESQLSGEIGSVDKLAAIDWVASAFGGKDVDSSLAPSPLAWAIYDAYKDDRITFFNNFFSKTLPSSRQIELIGFSDNRKENQELFRRLEEGVLGEED